MPPTITPLLSAARLALPQLPLLVQDPDEVARRIAGLLDRAARGEDPGPLEDELLALAIGQPQLRRFLSGLNRRGGTYRSFPAVQGGAQGTLSNRAGAELPPVVPERGRGTRHVNAYIAGPDAPEPLQHPLTPGGGYELRVHVGAPLPQSLLDPVDSVLKLPVPLGDGRWLRAVLDVGVDVPPVVAPLFVAANGESFSCLCEYGRAHGAGCIRDPWTVLRFAVPQAPSVLTARLIVYQDAVALHVQEITLPVAVGGHGPTARLVSRLTETFADLDDLADRSASVVLSEGTSRLTVNGLGFTAAPFTVAPGRSDSAVSTLRATLYDVHLRREAGGEVSRYDRNLGKPHAEFLRDLAVLAHAGSQVFATLFHPAQPDPTTPWSLPALLRHEALLRGRPPLFQVTDPEYTDRSVVWQAVYDLPMGGDTGDYVPCPSLEDPNRFADVPTPPLCPHDEEHRGQRNVLCPWGFWGFSTLLEQPPDCPVPGRKQGPQPPSCLVVCGPRLQPLDAVHLAGLRNTLGAASVQAAVAGSESELAGALRGDDLDVAYFYCHCGYLEGASGAGVDRYLEFEGFRITAHDVIAWARAERTWPRGHWRSRAPLVVLNGCHTAEFSTHTLNSFVPAFTRWANAGGVIGTEVTVHQTVANWVGQELLAGLWAGRSVADAVRDLRWRLLARGNVMGLAYTPYCRGDLTVTG